VADVDWTLVAQAVTAVATLAVPVVVAVMAHRFNDQLKRWEANQWRNQELIRARLEYYRELVPQLNDLMCYLTFIGRWKEMTPPEAIGIKRTLDRSFYCAAPLFSEDVLKGYDVFMDACFVVFGGMGTNARLRSTFGPRQQAAGVDWDPAWAEHFTHPADAGHPVDEIVAIRRAYDALISGFANDIELNAPRQRYLTADDSRPW
jgi:hypothetical protein